MRSYLLKETDAPTVVDKRHAARISSQRGARPMRAALETQQKGDGWNIRSFDFLIGRHEAHALESFIPRLSKRQRSAVGHDTRSLKYC